MAQGFEDIIRQDEELVIQKSIDEFTRAIERAGFQHGDLLDAIALASTGLAAIRLAGIPNDKLMEIVQIALNNTKEEEDGTARTESVQEGSGSKGGCERTSDKS